MKRKKQPTAAAAAPALATSPWDKPYLADGEIAAAIGIPPSLWAACKRDGDSPPLFQIGRRLFVKTDDLRAWLDGKAARGAPGSKRLRERAAI